MLYTTLTFGGRSLQVFKTNRIAYQLKDSRGSSNPSFIYTF